MATKSIDVTTLKSWLSDGGEIAFLDVREQGQYGEGHPFFAVPQPFSRFEYGLPALAPNANVRVVLFDDGDGVAGRAAGRAVSMGYKSVHVVEGGAPAWKAAGYTLYAGVNVPSKTFGELIEQRRHTPRITAEELQRRTQSGENIKIIDGRPFAEFNKMSIPGGISCPNGDLALHLEAIGQDPDTTIVVNCAGRTRSIIGAQTLIELGIANPVFALENGTQGWFLAGLELAHGVSKQLLKPNPPRVSDEVRARVRERAIRYGAGFASAKDVQAWLADSSRTTFLLDVRSPEEHVSDPPAGFVNAPGGQLIQATDQWVGVKGARLVLADSDGVRATVVAGWLAQLGHQVAVLEGGLAAGGDLKRIKPVKSPRLPVLAPIGVRELAKALQEGEFTALDLRGSMAYRKGHIAQAVWSVRPRLANAPRNASAPVALIADSQITASLAAIDLAEEGAPDIRLLSGGHAAWVAAGLPVVSTPGTPADADCIDFLFFVHDRHQGNAEAARQYLAWETGLLAQLDAQERGVFKIAD